MLCLLLPDLAPLSMAAWLWHSCGDPAAAGAPALSKVLSDCDVSGAAGVSILGEHIQHRIHVIRRLQMDYDQEYNMPIGMTPQRRTEEERDPTKVGPDVA